MLIKLADLIKKFNLNIRGIFHIGAHLAEEANDYLEFDIKNVVWIEANKQLLIELKKIVEFVNIQPLYNYNWSCYNATIFSQDNIDVIFNITNNGQSSSMLDFGTHSTHHPHVHIVDKVIVQTKRMDTLIKENNIDINLYNFMNLDIQGMELEALKSMEDHLKTIDYIYTEVNKEHVYQEWGAMCEESDS